MKILITGINGYIGTRMAPLLVARGHVVAGIDTNFYAEGNLYNEPESFKGKVIQKDTRNVSIEDLRGFDGVVHLADLSNDPLGQQDQQLTYDINFHATVNLAKLAKEAGVKRFVYASSCSAYGIATEDMVSEESVVNPQTAYAKCKVLVENELKKMADGNFSVTMMRNATVFGPSPRMRFDLVVNNLSGLAFTTGEIKMTSDGTPWRPLVHVLDVCDAFALTLEAPVKDVNGQVLNVGASNGNYTIKQVAEIIAGVFPGCKLSFGNSDGDTRSYKVNFDKIKRVLPGFNPVRTVETGAKELREIFEKIGLTPEMFGAKEYTRLKQIDFLRKERLINEKLEWVK